VIISLLSWLEKESYERVVIFIIKIQSIFRYKLAQRIINERKHQKIKELFEKTKLL
jgi:hypothetical protein